MAKEFRAIKPEIRVLGIDDGRFTPRTTGDVIVVGVVLRGGGSIDGVMHTHVAIDGLDATRQIASMINNSPHRKQLRLVMLNGITFAGFNLVDIQQLSLATNLPVIALTDTEPDLDAIHKALNNLPDTDARWGIVLQAGQIHEVNCMGKRLFMVLAGLSLSDAETVVKLTATRSCLPEPLRIAHLVASGITP